MKIDTVTVHYLDPADGKYCIKVQEADGCVEISRIEVDGECRSCIRVTVDEFRAIVNLLKPFANVSIDEAMLKDLRKQGEKQSPVYAPIGYPPYNGYPHPLAPSKVSDYPSAPPIWCEANK